LKNEAVKDKMKKSEDLQIGGKAFGINRERNSKTERGKQGQLHNSGREI